MHSVAVQLERQSLQEGNIIRHHFLVAEVELVHDDGIDVVVGEQVVWGEHLSNMTRNLLSNMTTNKFFVKHVIIEYVQICDNDEAIVIRIDNARVSWQLTWLLSIMSISCSSIMVVGEQVV